MRRTGIDVVYFGTASSDTLAETYIIGLWCEYRHGKVL